MIYLASPYTDSDPAVMQRRFELVAGAAACLLQQGHMIYSPILHFHPLSLLHELPGDFAFWQDMNMHMLAMADALWVLRLDGWEKSAGVTAERAKALFDEIPTVYFDPAACGVPSA